MVSVGSIRVGGAGKTPLASEIARILLEMGEEPAIVLRGYGGAHRGPPVEVTASNCDSRLHGDEACLHARRGLGRTTIARSRLEGVARAHAAGCTVAVLDDGMQHRAIARDLEIVTLPEENPLANGRLLPRGPLREPPAALARADVAILSHATDPDRSARAKSVVSPWLRPGTPILSWKGTLRVEAGDRALPPGCRVGLLCGIARPDSFRLTVESAGFEVAWVMAYPDHHSFAAAEVEAALRRADEEGLEAVLVTEKDAVRMKTTAQGQRARCAVARIDLEWVPPDAGTVLREILGQALARARSR